jgi:2C-methyl-D-erythritol 2,4-cyclodiphosphate synthase
MTNMASLKFLTEAANLLWQNGFQIVNIDSNILAETPKLLPYFPAMRKGWRPPGVPIERIFVKAKDYGRYWPMARAKPLLLKR